MKTQALKMALNQYKYDLAFGGARRDEEKSRAKERIFLSGLNLTHGIQKTKDQSYGVILMLGKRKGVNKGFSAIKLD